MAPPSPGGARNAAGAGAARAAGVTDVLHGEVRRGARGGVRRRAGRGTSQEVTRLMSARTPARKRRCADSSRCRPATLARGRQDECERRSGQTPRPSFQQQQTTTRAVQAGSGCSQWNLYSSHSVTAATPMPCTTIRWAEGGRTPPARVARTLSPREEGGADAVVAGGGPRGAWAHRVRGATASGVAPSTRDLVDALCLSVGGGARGARSAQINRRRLLRAWIL